MVYRDLSGLYHDQYSDQHYDTIKHILETHSPDLQNDTTFCLWIASKLEGFAENFQHGGIEKPFMTRHYKKFLKLILKYAIFF